MISVGVILQCGLLGTLRRAHSATGELGDAKVIRRFGDSPEDLSAL
jgi:hypothetical protein